MPPTQETPCNDPSSWYHLGIYWPCICPALGHRVHQSQHWFWVDNFRAGAWRFHGSRAWQLLRNMEDVHFTHCWLLVTYMRMSVENSKNMTGFIGQSRTYQKNDVLHSVGTPEDLLMTCISGGESLQIFLLELQRLYSCMPVQVSPPHTSQPHQHHPEKAKGVGVEREKCSLFRLH